MWKMVTSTCYHKERKIPFDTVGIDVQEVWSIDTVQV